MPEDRPIATGTAATRSRHPRAAARSSEGGRASSILQKRLAFRGVVKDDREWRKAVDIRVRRSARRI